MAPPNTLALCCNHTSHGTKTTMESKALCQSRCTLFLARNRHAIKPSTSAGGLTPCQLRHHSDLNQTSLL
jgi:hypothetical protein